MRKVPGSLRLTPVCWGLIRDIAERKGIPMCNVIEEAVREKGDREGFRYDPTPVRDGRRKAQ